MKQTPSAPAAGSTSNPSTKFKKRQDAKTARRALADSYERQLAAHIKDTEKPRHPPVITQHQETLVDGNTQVVKVWRRGCRQEHVDARQRIAPFFGRIPTDANLAVAASFNSVAEDVYGQAKKTIIEGFSNGDLTPFFTSLAQHGPRLLCDRELNVIVEGWWFTLLDPCVSREERKVARKNLQLLGDSLLTVASGNQARVTEERKHAIVEDYKKWRPIVKGLNTAFKKLGETLDYTNSERQEVRSRLAQEFSISAEEVEAIEWRLKKPSRKARKSTPTAAICHIVAREHPGVGEKTVEKIWRDHLQIHPEERRKGRKTPTTPSVGERTA